MNDVNEFNNQTLSSSEETQPEKVGEEQSAAEQDLAAHSSHTEGQKGAESRTPNYEEFLNQLKELSSPDDKLELAIRFMEQALAQSGNPDFKHFWEVRKLCLDFFKEPVNPAMRSALWTKYSELSKEARRLKEILDEQTAFAVEQIDIAITALELEAERFEENLDKVPSVIFPETTGAFAEHLPFYENLQRKLNLLNAEASRVNLLRKELMKTEMRVRQKNRFFQRLSAIGDKVFPQRKDLIKEISQRFMADVDAFIAANFPFNPKKSQPFHLLREEIKTLQGIAKILTLNTHAFNQTRLKLSECWDQIRVAEKELKKERTQQRTQSKDRLQSWLKQLEEIRVLYREQQKGARETDRALDDLGHQIRRSDLMRDDQKLLREEIDRFRKEVDEVLHAEKNAKEREEKEAQRQRQEAFKELKNRLNALHKDAATIELEDLKGQIEEINQQIETLTISKSERHELERALKPLNDLLFEREESQISLSGDEKQALNQLYEILEQRRERQKEIKAQLQNLRKLSGSSGLDIEQAMLHNEKMQTERERLEKITQGIEEIEAKISLIKKKT